MARLRVSATSAPQTPVKEMRGAVARRVVREDEMEDGKRGDEVSAAETKADMEEELTTLSKHVAVKRKRKATKEPATSQTLPKAPPIRGPSIPSLAHLIESTDRHSYAFDLSADTDSEDEEDIGSICQNIESKLTKYNSSVIDVEYEEHKNPPTTPPIINSTTVATRRSPSISPPSPPSLKIPRHRSIIPYYPPSSSRQRAANFNFRRNPCYDPNFPGHSPCATHEEGWYGRSADDALEVTRKRFAVLHFESANTGHVRSRQDRKMEIGMDMRVGAEMAMLYGESRLRLAVGVDEEEEEEFGDAGQGRGSSLPAVEHRSGWHGDGLEGGGNIEEDVEDPGEGDCDSGWCMT